MRSNRLLTFCQVSFGIKIIFICTIITICAFVLHRFSRVTIVTQALQVSQVKAYVLVGNILRGQLDDMIYLGGPCPAYPACISVTHQGTQAYSLPCLRMIEGFSPVFSHNVYKIKTAQYQSLTNSRANHYRPIK